MCFLLFLTAFLTTRPGLESFIEHVKTISNAARRSYPIPTDFENTLQRFGVPLSTLKAHLKPKLPKSKRKPNFEPLAVQYDMDVDLPILGVELDGSSEKEAKAFIPSSFPSFPSTHTYKYTPENVEDVTASADSGALNESYVPSQSMTDQKQAPSRPLAPEEIPRGDPKKIREAAAKEAKLGEEALRGFLRATKIAMQKEVRAEAQKHTVRKERYDIWESAMREMVEDDDKAKGNPVTGRFEIADYSTMVNAESKYFRKEVPRAAPKKLSAADRMRKANGDGITGWG